MLIICERLVLFFKLKLGVCSFSIYITETLIEKIQKKKKFCICVLHEVSNQFEIFFCCISHLRHYYTVTHLNSYKWVNKTKNSFSNIVDDVRCRLWIIEMWITFVFHYDAILTSKAYLQFSYCLKKCKRIIYLYYKSSKSYRVSFFRLTGFSNFYHKIIC